MGARVLVDPAERPRLAFACAEDAMAIASQAEEWGFEESAAALRQFAQELRLRIGRPLAVAS